MKFWQLLLVTLVSLVVGCQTYEVLTEKPKSPPVYNRIDIEISPVNDYCPNQAQMDLLKKQLAAANICAYNNIRISVDQPIKFIETFILYEELWFLEKMTRKLPYGTNRLPNLQLHILYVNGTYIELDDVAGLTYGRTSIAVFKTHTDESIEATVILHEIGHIMGVAYNRQTEINPYRPYHCDNPNCVMFWTITEPGLKFDNACLMDIRRLGFKNRNP